MDFKGFKSALQQHLAAMFASSDHLFVVDVDRDAFYEEYLNSFPEGSNEIFRERREFDCSSCRNFIKSFGAVVAIKDSIVTTIWDFNTDDDPVYSPVVAALSAFIKSRAVTDVFVTKLPIFGTDKNFEEDKDSGKIITWEHLYTKLPAKFVDSTSRTEGDVAGGLRDIRNVFKRSLDEIHPGAIEAVLDLIASNTLYKGEEWQAVLKKFQTYQKTYRKLSETKKSNFCWEQSVVAGPVVGKIRSHSIGTLLVNISAGEDLEVAVKKYEQIVAPSNYKRPQAVFTKKMLEEAVKTIESLGFLDSLGRRYATLDDISVANILFANRDSARRISGAAAAFAEMAADIGVDPKMFDKVEEITAEVFVRDVLPTVKTIEALVENRHSGSMVSLIAPQVKDSPTMFKWGNGFSWAYAGNITDSMKERVKAAGGKVDGVLRFSIQWNEGGDNDNDYDAHCVEPTRSEIFFGSPRNIQTTGMLDVDIRMPSREIGNRTAVENITWSDRAKMKDGEYVFYVHNYSYRGGRDGFCAEIEFDGQVHQFDCRRDIRQSEKVEVARVVKTGGAFVIKPTLESTTSSREIWGLQSNQFHPVAVVMYSPNYWDLQEGIGHRHFFFMLKSCVNSESPNGFFNEYLRQDLLDHKRVFEALGAKMRVADAADQLSGLGFSATKRDFLVVRTTGAVKRVLKITF